MGTRNMTSDDQRLTVSGPDGPVTVGEPFHVRVQAEGGSGPLPPEAYLITTVVFFGVEGETPAEEPVACDPASWVYSVDVDPRWDPPQGCRYEADPADGSKGGVPAVDATAAFTALRPGDYIVAAGFACGMYGSQILEFPITAQPAPPGTSGVTITSVRYKGTVPRTQADEYAEITNNGSAPVVLTGWRLNAGDTGQDFTFPDYTLAPGAACRVYTNEIHQEWGGFSFGRGRSLWSDSGDTGYLYDSAGELVSTYAYGSDAPAP